VSNGRTGKARAASKRRRQVGALGLTAQKHFGKSGMLGQGGA
jgi:hypothetical protein